MQNTGLVLEGGGMRGAFTAGVLRYMMEEDLYVPYTIGVSAGACNGSSYIARQMNRNHQVIIEYSHHPEYISFRRFLRSRELFGMDLIFDKMPNELIPFDMETFCSSKEGFVVGTTDCVTGEAVYFDKHSYSKDMLTILRASSSLPLFAPEVAFNDRYLLDGGVADPIPIKKSMRDGNTKNIVVLTKNKGYREAPSNWNWFASRKYGKYKGLLKAMKNHHIVYNDTIEFLEEEEEKGNVVIIRPIRRLDVSSIERNPQKLETLYEEGYEEAKKAYGKLKNLL